MFKLINYDICNGMVYIYKKLIALIVFILIMLMYNRFVVLNSPVEDIYISLGDYLVYLFKGSKPFDIQNLDIPVVFIGIHMFISMMIGYYAVDDIHGYGKQVFIRCGKKSLWWYSKCIWIVCTVFVSYSLIYLTVFVFGACSGAQMTLNVNDSIFMYFEKLSLAGIQGMELLLHMFVTPLLYSIAISIFQVMMSLLVGPILSFITVMVYTILSVMVAKPILVCNYSMIMRNKYVLGTDMTCQTGIILLLLMSIVCIVIGRVIVNKKDISL